MKLTNEEMLANVGTGQTAQPQQAINAVEDPQRDLSFSADYDMARSDGDVEYQRKVIAEDKQIPLEDVQMTDDGWAYKSGDEWLLAQSSGFGWDEFGAGALSNTGALIGGIGGSLLSPAGAIGGAMIGDVAQTGIEDFLEDREPRGAGDYATSAITEGAFALGGEIALPLAKAGGRAVKNTFFPPTKVGTDDVAKAINLSDSAKAEGINLTPAEALKDKQMLNAQSFIRDVPNRSASTMDTFLETRAGNVESAINRQVNQGMSPQEVFAKYKNALLEKRAGLVDERQLASGQYYDKASANMADISDVLIPLYKQIESASGTKIGGSLLRVRNALTRMDGETRIPKELIGELHLAKMDIDDMIEFNSRNGNGNAVFMLMKVKENLVDVLEQASDDYAMGLKSYKDYSVPINRFDDGITGASLKESEKHSPNLGKTLFGANSSPEQVAFARKTIANDDLFEEMVTAHLQRTFNDLKFSATDDSLNTGGLFAKAIFGSKNKRDMLKAGLSAEKYQALEDFVEILRATGRGFKGQSMTAQRQIMRDKATPSGFNPIKKASDAYKEAKFNQTTERMARLLTNDYNHNSLKKIANDIREFSNATTPEASKRYQNALADGMVLLTGGGFENEVER